MDCGAQDSARKINWKFLCIWLLLLVAAVVVVVVVVVVDCCCCCCWLLIVGRWLLLVSCWLFLLVCWLLIVDCCSCFFRMGLLNPTTPKAFCKRKNWWKNHIHGHRHNNLAEFAVCSHVLEYIFGFGNPNLNQPSRSRIFINPSKARINHTKLSFLVGWLVDC